MDGPVFPHVRRPSAGSWALLAQPLSVSVDSWMAKVDRANQKVLTLAPDLAWMPFLHINFF